MKMRLLFQFHKGTIKTSAEPTMQFFKFDFNSIKVQLKPEQWYYV